MLLSYISLAMKRALPRWSGKALTAKSLCPIGSV